MFMGKSLYTVTIPWYTLGSKKYEFGEEVKMTKTWNLIETDYALRACKALKEKDYLALVYTTEYLIEIKRLIEQSMNIEELEMEVIKLTVEIDRIDELMKTRDGRAERLDLYEFRKDKSDRRYLIKEFLLRNKYSL